MIVVISNFNSHSNSRRQFLLYKIQMCTSRSVQRIPLAFSNTPLSEVSQRMVSVSAPMAIEESGTSTRRVADDHSGAWAGCTFTFDKFSPGLDNTIGTYATNYAIGAACLAAVLVQVILVQRRGRKRDFN